LPQIHQWDFIFEREIARNTVVSASYLGSFGNSLPNFVDTNLNAPVFVNLNVVGGPLDGSTYRSPLFMTETLGNVCGADRNSQRHLFRVSRAGVASESPVDRWSAVPG
jgi:hypothetical protein